MSDRRDKTIVRVWHALLGAVAYDLQRTAVLPLFECAGFLSAQSRNGWVLHAAMPQQRSLGNATEVHDEVCLYRAGEGCFEQLALPEEVAMTPHDQRVVVSLPVKVFKLGGVGAVLQAARNASRRRRDTRTPQALLLDIHELSRDLEEDTLRDTIEQFLLTEAPSAWALSHSLGSGGAGQIPREPSSHGGRRRLRQRRGRGRGLSGLEGNSTWQRPQGQQHAAASSLSRLNMRGKPGYDAHGIPLVRRRPWSGLRPWDLAIQVYMRSCLFTNMMGMVSVC